MKTTAPPTKQELMAALLELSEKYPDMRLGQLVANVACWAKGPIKSAVWDVEDDEFLAVVKEHLSRR